MLLCYTNLYAYNSFIVLLSLLLLVGFDDVGNLILTDRTVHLVLHGKFSLALGGTSELGGIAEHRCEGNISIEDEKTCLGLCIGDCTTATHKLTHNRGLVLRRHSDFNIHNRLKDLRLGFLEGLAEGVFGCNAESKGTGIDDVGLTIS